MSINHEGTAAPPLRGPTHSTVVLPGSRSPESMVGLHTSSFYGAQDQNSQNLRWELSDIPMMSSLGESRRHHTPADFPLNPMSQRHIPAAGPCLCAPLLNSECSNPCDVVFLVNTCISAAMGSVPLWLSDLQHQISHHSGEDPGPKSLVPRDSVP